MVHSPYIGITDFMNPEQVQAMLNLFISHRQVASTRKLHVGVMMSYKTLHDLPTKWLAAFPKNEAVSEIFIDHPLLLNVLHYADYDALDVFNSLLRATVYGGKNLHALQLDMVWPDPMIVRAFREKHQNIQIIVQVNTRALELVANDPKGMVKRLAEYGDSIDYVLLDKSMGKGLGMDAHGLIPFVRAVRDAFPHLGIAAAGGLGPKTFQLVTPLVQAFPDISVDAQGKLRPSGNALEPIDWKMAGLYLTNTTELVG